MTKSLEMKIKPLWQEIENVRNETTIFLNGNGCGDDIVNAVSMVSSELVENAVKYGHFLESEGSIQLCLEIGSRIIIVEVKSPMSDSADDNLRRLDEAIRWIRGYQNPFDAYVEKLKEVSAGTNEDESGMGLVRIAYEGQSLLDFYVDEDNTLAMCAVYKI